MEEKQSVNWFPAVLATICGIGVGVAIGIGIATAAANKELAEARAVNEEQQQEISALTRGAVDVKAKATKLAEVCTKTIESYEKNFTARDKTEGELNDRIAEIEKQLKQKQPSVNLATEKNSNLKGGDRTSSATKWRVIKQWAITGIKTTETFSVTQRSWRIRWESDGSAGYAVYHPGDKIVTHGSADQSDWSMIQEGAGTYYLELSTAGKATFFAEEQE